MAKRIPDTKIRKAIRLGEGSEDYGVMVPRQYIGDGIAYRFISYELEICLVNYDHNIIAQRIQQFIEVVRATDCAGWVIWS